MIRAPLDRGPDTVTDHKGGECKYAATGELVVAEGETNKHIGNQPAKVRTLEGFTSAPDTTTTLSLSVVALTMLASKSNVGINSVTTSAIYTSAQTVVTPAPPIVSGQTPQAQTPQAQTSTPVLDYDATLTDVGKNETISWLDNSGSLGTTMRASAFGQQNNLPTVGVSCGIKHVVFDRAHQQYLSISAPLQMSWLNNSGSFAGFTFFVKAQYTGSPANYERFFDFGNGAASDNVLLCRAGASTDGYGEVFNQGSSIIRGYSHGLDKNFHTHVLNIANTSTGCIIKVYIDSVSNLVSTQTSVTPLTNRTTTLNYIGRSNWSGDSFLSGNIRQLMMYDHSMSDQDMTSVLASMP